MVLIAKESTPPSAEELARGFLERKLRGQRVITQNFQFTRTLRNEAIFKRARQIFSRLSSRPDIRRQLDSVSELKSRARRLGFKSIKEFQRVQPRLVKQIARQQITQPLFRKPKVIRAPIIIPKAKARRLLPKAKPIGTGIKFTGLAITAAPRKTFISRQEERRGILRTKKLRGIKLTSKEKLELASRTGFQSAAQFGVGIVKLPASLISVAKNPKQLTKVPSRLKRGAEEFGELLRISPSEAFVKIGTEVFLTKGAGDVLSIVGKVGKSSAAKLSPSFRKVEKGIITIPAKQTGKTIKLRVVGAINTFEQSLKAQALIAGTTVNAVSSQANRLVSLLRSKRIIRKPLPNEKFLPSQTKKLLKKFDAGTINKKELVILQSRLPLLERSFFADPSGRVRPSRLGLGSRRASLLDFLSGDFTFRVSKPQILLFDNIKVAKFPQALKDIGRTLQQNKQLSKSQASRLFEFQQKKSGQFKPIGFVGKEPEITLAPGEIVSRVGRVGTTVIDGVAIPILRVKVGVPTAKVAKLLRDAKKGGLTLADLKKIERAIQKETGFRPDLSLSTAVKSPTLRKPVVSIRVGVASISPKPSPPKGASATPSPTPSSPAVPSKPSTTVTPSKPSATPSPKSVPSKVSVSRAAKAASVAKKARGAKPIKALIPIKIKKRRKRKFKKKKIKRAYNVLARPLKKTKKSKRPKLIKVNKVPITKQRAKDVRNFLLDTSLARAGRIKRIKGKPKNAKLKVPVGYGKRTTKKFRRFRFVKGKRVPLKRGSVIERKRFLLDTKQEQRKITLRRRIKQLTPKKKKVVKKAPVKKRINGARRRQLLANLKKARKVKADLRKSGRRRVASAQATTAFRRKVSII